MRSLRVRGWLVCVAALAALAFLSGIGGLMIACHSSALIPANLDSHGHCFATDTPREVFASFAVLGLLLSPFFVIAGGMLSWLMRRNRNFK